MKISSFISFVVYMHRSAQSHWTEKPSSVKKIIIIINIYFKWFPWLHGILGTSIYSTLWRWCWFPSLNIGWEKRRESVNLSKQRFSFFFYPSGQSLSQREETKTFEHYEDLMGFNWLMESTGPCRKLGLTRPLAMKKQFCVKPAEASRRRPSVATQLQRQQTWHWNLQRRPA